MNKKERNAIEHTIKNYDKYFIDEETNLISESLKVMDEVLKDFNSWVGFRLYLVDYLPPKETRGARSAIIRVLCDKMGNINTCANLYKNYNAHAKKMEDIGVFSKQKDNDYRMSQLKIAMKGLEECEIFLFPKRFKRGTKRAYLFPLPHPRRLKEFERFRDARH
jgi:hypothetical protein